MDLNNTASSRPAWMDDELVKDIPQKKLDFAAMLFETGHGKSQKAEATKRAEKLPQFLSRDKARTEEAANIRKRQRQNAHFFHFKLLLTKGKYSTFSTAFPPFRQGGKKETLHFAASLSLEGVISWSMI